MQRFTLPRDTYFGENAMEHLKNLDGKRAIIVFGSERMIKDGTVGKIEEYLKEAESKLSSSLALKLTQLLQQLCAAQKQ